jgi:hypothetical protein
VTVAAFSFKRDFSCIQQIFIVPEHFKLCLYVDPVFQRERFIKGFYYFYFRTKSVWTCETSWDTPFRLRCCKF